MDIEEIRRMIRQSIKEQTKKLVEERLKPPATFEKFNSLVSELLMNIDSSEDFPSQDEIYGMWRNISTEVSKCDMNDLISEWNASLAYHLDGIEASKKTKQAFFRHLKR